MYLHSKSKVICISSAQIRLDIRRWLLCQSNINIFYDHVLHVVWNGTQIDNLGIISQLYWTLVYPMHHANTIQMRKLIHWLLSKSRVQIKETHQHAPWYLITNVISTIIALKMPKGLTYTIWVINTFFAVDSKSNVNQIVSKWHWYGYVIKTLKSTQ